MEGSTEIVLQTRGRDISRCCLTLVLPLCSLEQLGFNALLQLMIGVPLEMVHGVLRISLLYMAGVLAGECLIIIKYIGGFWLAC